MLRIPETNFLHGICTKHITSSFGANGTTAERLNAAGATTPLQYTSISAGRKAGHAVAHVMAVSKVSAIARPIPTVASLGAMCPLLMRQIDVAMSDLEGLNGKMCELLHTSGVVQKMQVTFDLVESEAPSHGSRTKPETFSTRHIGFQLF
jgi:phage tail sheath gpL-like